MEDGSESGSSSSSDNLVGVPTFSAKYHLQQPSHLPTFLDGFTTTLPTATESSHIELYAVVGLLSTFVIVGSAGNAIVLWVFCRRRDQLVSTVFIVVLAGVDFITCLVAVPFTIVFEMLDFHVGSNIACKLYQFMITCNIPFSAMIMVAIAVDRYLCICHPFVHALTVRRAWTTSGVLGVCASAIGICVALMYSVDGRIVTTSGIASHKLSAAADSKNENFTTSTSLPQTSAESWTGSDGLAFRSIQCGDDGSNGRPRLEDVFVGEVSTSINEWNISVQCKQQVPEVAVLVDMGLCRPSDQMFSADFIWYFQKFYNGLFLACVIIVVFLYALIYRSVVERRSRRQRQKSNSLAVATSTIRVIDAQPPQTFRPCSVVEPASVNDDGGPPVDDDDVVNGRRRDVLMMTITGSHEIRTSVDYRLEPPTSNGNCRDTDFENIRRHLRDARRSIALALPPSLRERNRIRVASLKTAAMLFVVTVVFVATFLPAFLMTVNILPYRMFVFYMYFANNVANPFIYSFMNQNFRENLQRLFCRNWSPPLPLVNNK